MIESALREGLHARPPTLDDVPAVAALIAAHELDVFGNTEMTGDLLLDDWDGVDLSREAVIVVAPDGKVAAAGYLFHHGKATFSVYGYVQPLQRGEGLGTFLVGWAEQAARAYLQSATVDEPINVRHYPALPDSEALRLLVEQGYVPGRSFYVMEMTLDEPPLSSGWPEGIAIRSFQPEQDGQATFETFEASFQDHWSSMITKASFLEMTEAASFDPDLWHLAFDGGEMVGVCFSKLVDGSGWIDDIGVRREWRNRGIGLALLRHAVEILYERGAVAVGLSVDAESSTGAPRLYERAGMYVKRTYVLHQKALRSDIETLG